MSSPDTPSPRLPRGLIFLFVLPALLVGFMHGPEQQLPGIYAKYAGLTLAALAAATLLTRAFDAVTYPLIGYLSDLSYAKTGTRKPWVVVGALLSAVGVWFLYRPPEDVDILYFGIWAGITYLGWKVAEIPYQAWSYTLTRDYAQRARVQAWRAIALLLGNMLFFGTPALAKGLGWTDAAELNFGALNVTAILCAVLVPLVAILVIWRVPEGEVAPPTPSEQQRYGLMQTVRAVIGNGPLMRLLVALLPVAMLTGMSVGVAFLFLDVYLKLGESFPTIMLISVPFALLAVPFWSFLAIKFERHRVMSVSLIIGAFAYLGQAFVSPGPDAALVVMVLYPITIFAVAGIVVIFPMIGDIADYGRLKTGEELAGLYTAMVNFVQVSIRTVSSAAGIAVVGWLGFNAEVTTQTAAGEFAIRLVAVILPAIGVAFAGFLFWTFPLTRARLADIHAQLAEREARATNEAGAVSS